MTTFCEHKYDGESALTTDCDCCTLKRGRKVGFCQAEEERDAVRKKNGAPIRRFSGGVRMGKAGWQTWDMKGNQID